MKQADLLKKIEQLEDRIRQLEAMPLHVLYALPYQNPPTVGPWPYWQGPYCASAVGSAGAGNVCQ